MSRTWLAVGLLVLAGVARAAPSVPDSAHASGAPDRGSDRLEGRLLIDHERVRPGEPFRVGVLLEMDRHWHVYWRNSGQSGAPPKLTWQIPGAQVGALEWPFPGVFREAEGFITTYGYTDEVLLASPAVFASGVSGPVEIKVDADVLVCEIQCIPGELHLSRLIEVGGESRASAEFELFERWHAKVPRPLGDRGLALEALYSQSAVRPGDSFKAALSVHACADGRPDAEPCAELEAGTDRLEDAFVPDRAGTIEIAVTGARRPEFLQGGFLLTLSGSASPDAEPSDSRLRGVLAVTRAGQPEYVEVDLPLPRAAAGAQVATLANPWLEPEPSQSGPALPFWQAILLALLGGVILNAMPCVLPVLAIKVFGLAELAQHGRAEILRHGIAYTVGVLFSMLALAAVVVALRAAGTQVGWGFQFQEPLFVAAISAVLVVFALSLFGVFEFRLDTTAVAGFGSQATGARRSFFEGLLAVVLATPCTAPFVGTAVGFAFASSTATIAAIFLAIGFGLALPFLLICLVPAWARLVPRSGPWTVQLRAALGFALLGTVVWLLWVLGRAAGADAQAVLLAYLCLLAAGVWVFGAIQQAERVTLARIALVALVGLALFGLRNLPVSAAPGAAAAAEDSLGRKFSASDVAESRARGPVFVYFTAEWCLTCKVNEHVVLDDARVRQELEARRFEVFKGDWTHRDEAIRTELARYGRAGVPLYLVYGSGETAQPIVLPELLTVDLFLNALQQVAPTPEDKT